MDKPEEQRPNILYVDDIQNNLTLFEVLFKDIYNVSVASSGKKALALLKEQEFAVLISDQSMPEMSGTELMEIAKKEYPDMMRFILTAYTDYKTVVDSINKGEIYGFFNKPFDSEQMKLSLDKAIEVYNLRNLNKKMVKELEKVNTELIELDKSKTRYLNVITNEIRTPINKIMSAVHMLKDRIATNDLSELLFYLDTSVSRLESYSFAANQLARLHENSSPLEFKEVSLRELIEHCIVENNIILKKFSVNIDCPEHDRELTVKGESELLLACLTTLLMNSLKHAEKNKSIQLKYGESGENPFLEIIDEGSLYSSHQVESLMNFFTDNQKNSDFSPGIEIILAKQIMISHGGQILITLDEKNKRVSTKMIFSN